MMEKELTIESHTALKVHQPHHEEVAKANRVGFHLKDN